MNIYGDGTGSPVIMINPKDKGRIKQEDWGGVPIETDEQKEGSVTFGRGAFGLEDVRGRKRPNDDTRDTQKRHHKGRNNGNNKP